MPITTQILQVKNRELMKIMINCRRSLYKLKGIYRFYSSALYITGDKAQTNFAVLTPVIEFDKQLTKKDDLVKNIRSRGLDINIEEIVKKWEFFQDILQRKNTLDQTRIEIGQNIAKLLKLPDTDPQEVEKLKMHAKLIKEDLKHLKESFYDVEESTMVKVLSLPNTLHPETPLGDEKILYTHLQKPTNSSLHHLEIGEEMNYLKYIDSFACYLKTDLALLEQNLLNYFRMALLGSNYLQFSNPNFCRSVISEGCSQICHSDKNMFTIKEQNHLEDSLNKLHLCGSATLYSFMSYFCRHLVPKTAFPLKYFNIGRVYQPVINKGRSLFNLSQQSVVNIFLADLEDSSDNLDYLIDQISDIYNSLNLHYRIAILPASKIENAESLRISVQMFSNFENKYVEVGNVSLYDNYVSKRLLFTYLSNKEKQYPKIISGSLLNFHKFLGCFIENVGKNSLSERLKDFYFNKE